MNKIRVGSRNAKSNRSGSAMVMVLVVMIVVGLMVLQSSQLLIAFYQGDRQQRILEQNRELLELGIAKAEKSMAHDKEYAGEAFSVPVWDNAPSNGETFPERTGRIHIEILNSSDGTASGVRITAKFPSGEPGEIVSTWESQ